jgi:hypothetical protein
MAGWMAVALVLLGGPVASAASDVFGNVSPASPVQAGLADRYPLGNYALDTHFDAVEASLTGGVDVSGVPPMIAHFLANALWQLTAFLADALITLFGFAFSLDLVRGSKATGGAGALEPVGQAIRTLYANVLGRPWLAVSIAIVGLWAMWRALVQRRYTETVGALGISLLFVVLALAFVTQPERTIGQATRWTNQMSLTFLSLSHGGTLSSADEAKRAAADQLFTLLVDDPWVVLQFGGREHCVRDGTGSDDENPESAPVRPLSQNPSTDAELARRLAVGTQVRADGKTCINNANKYVPHFLPFASGSDQRDAEYEAINAGDAGKLPEEDPSKQRGDYQLGIADKPAADAMEADGQYQRLLIALVIFAGELGAFLLLGALSIGVILAQILLLLLLAFAPVALVLGVIPGRGHDFFRGWLTRIAGSLLRKAVYSLILAVLLAVNAALAEATSNLGWLLSFGLQGLFFWTVFLYRRKLTDQLLAATAGRDHALPGAATLASVYYGTRLATRPGRAGRRSLGALNSGLGRLRAPAPPPGDGPEPPPEPGAPGAPPVPPGPGHPPLDGDRSGRAADDGEREAEIPTPLPGDQPASRQRPGADRTDEQPPRDQNNGASSLAPPSSRRPAEPQREDVARERPGRRHGRVRDGVPPAAAGPDAPRRGTEDSPLLEHLRTDRDRIGDYRSVGQESPGGRPPGADAPNDEEGRGQGGRR